MFARFARKMHGLVLQYSYGVRSSLEVSRPRLRFYCNKAEAWLQQSKGGSCGKKRSQQGNKGHKRGAGGGDTVDDFVAGDVVLDAAQALFVIPGVLFKFAKPAVGYLLDVLLLDFERVDLETEQIYGVFDLVGDEF